MSKSNLTKSLKLDIAICIIFLIAGIFSLFEMKYSVSIPYLIASVLFLFSIVRTYKENTKN